MENNEDQTKGDEQSDEDSNKGDKPQVSSPIAEADARIKRMEELNEEGKEILKGQQELEASRKMSGQAEGYSKGPEVTELQNKVNRAKEYFKGTSLEKDIAKANEQS